MSIISYALAVELRKRLVSFEKDKIKTCLELSARRPARRSSHFSLANRILFFFDPLTRTEWRKGPTGPRTLCNACGLQWVKMCRRAKEAGSTSTSTSTSQAVSVSNEMEEDESDDVVIKDSMSEAEKKALRDLKELRKELKRTASLKVKKNVPAIGPGTKIVVQKSRSVSDHQQIEPEPTWSSSSFSSSDFNRNQINSLQTSPTTSTSSDSLPSPALSTSGRIQSMSISSLISSEAPTPSSAPPRHSRSAGSTPFLTSRSLDNLDHLSGQHQRLSTSHYQSYPPQNQNASFTSPYSRPHSAYSYSGSFPSIRHQHPHPQVYLQPQHQYQSHHHQTATQFRSSSDRLAIPTLSNRQNFAEPHDGTDSGTVSQRRRRFS